MAKQYFSALARLAMWIVAAAAMIGLNLWVIVGNYIACVQSFQLLGFENKPLADDELIGPVFAAIAPEATVAHLLAGLFEAAVALALWWLAHYIYSLVQLFEDRSIYSSTGDLASRRIVDQKLLFTTLRLAILALPLFVAARTVVQLFRFRMIAQALGIEDPHKAPVTVLDFPLEMQQHGRLYAWNIAKDGAWGLLCGTLLIAICFELCCHKIAEAGARLEALSRANDDQSAAADGEPVAEPQGGSTEPVNDNHPAPTPWDSRPPDTEPVPDAPAPTGEEAREVIGGKEGLRVTIADAQAAPNLYWVDPETGDIWDRAHHDAIISGSPLDQAA